MADVVNKGTRQTAGTKLFAEGISPHDICQGQIGDCWLLSTLACLASRKGAIEFAFITAEVGTKARVPRRRAWDPGCFPTTLDLPLLPLTQVFPARSPFPPAQYNQQGRYRLQLFDVAENKFVRVSRRAVG